MATTTQSYTGDGVKGVAGQTQLTFDFPYIKQSDVKVSLNGVTLDTTKYTFPTATSIQFNAGTATSTQEASGAPKSGVDILFYRQTDVDSAKAIFATGSGIRAKDLNNNIDQALFALQEVQDIVRSEEIEDSAITSAKIKDDSIVNADVNSAAAIDGTKISPDFGSQVVQTTGNIVVGGTVDGRDIAGDGSKLDGIEDNATRDQDAGEIRTLVEAASDSNVFTDADHTKLNDIEDNATRDQDASEIRTLVEAASDSNVFTDADHAKLNNIEPLATADQDAAEIRALVESATDSNVFTDADHTKLNNLGSLNSLSDVNTAGVADGKILKYEASSSSFIIADDGGGGGGGGSSTFTGLSDTPANYGSAANKTLKINSAGDAVEFVDVTTSFAGLSDTPSLSGQAGKAVKINSNEDGVIYETINTDLVADTSPQLGGDLDVQSQDITTTTTNGNIKLYPAGTGKVEVKGSTNAGSVQFNCENNTNNVTIKGPDNSANANYTLTLPSSIQSGFLKTNTSGDLSFSNVSLDQLNAPNGQTRILVDNTDINLGYAPLKFDTDPNNGNFIKIQGPSTLTKDSTFTLPEDGGIGTFLTTDGSGVLSFSNNLYEWKSGTVGDLSDGDIIFKGVDESGGGSVTSDEFLHWDTSQIALKLGKYGTYQQGFGSWSTKMDTGDAYPQYSTIFRNTAAGKDLCFQSLNKIQFGTSDNNNTQVARFIMPISGSSTHGQCELRYVTANYGSSAVGSTKLTTTSTGVTVTGTVTATAGFSGSGANLTDIDAGATGTGTDKIFWENGTTVTQSYTVGTTFNAACNAMSAGPITINNSVVVTVDSGDTWTIV